MRSWDVFCQRLFAQNQFAIKLGLENMKSALESESKRLHVDLKASYPMIVVAGTNGKGSTAAFISAILQAHGLRVGLYTSPHLIDFRERFRVNGQLLPEAQVERIGSEILENFGETDGVNPCLTFFELTTMMAVRLFHEEKIDVGVYEVGLGGRLDAVNALEPTVSVITSIDYDHSQYLGTTLEGIAREKCGVFRADARAIIGFQEHPQVVRAIRALAPADTLYYGQDFGGGNGTDGVDLPESLRAAPGVMQLNAQTALAATHSYMGGEFESDKAVLGLECMRWPGRMDMRDVKVPGYDEGRGATGFLLDAAHNDASVRALFEHLKRADIMPGAVVLGAMADKDLGAMFAGLGALGLPVFGVEIENQRAAKAEQLEAAVVGADLVDSGGIWRGAGTSAWAFHEASNEVGDSGRVVLVFGSIYLLGEFLGWAGISPDALVTYEL